MLLFLLIMLFPKSTRRANKKVLLSNSEVHKTRNSKRRERLWLRAQTYSRVSNHLGLHLRLAS